MKFSSALRRKEPSNYEKTGKKLNVLSDRTEFEKATYYIGLQLYDILKRYNYWDSKKIRGYRSLRVEMNR